MGSFAPKVTVDGKFCPPGLSEWEVLPPKPLWVGGFAPKAALGPGRSAPHHPPAMCCSLRALLMQELPPPSLFSTSIHLSEIRLCFGPGAKISGSHHKRFPALHPRRASVSLLAEPRAGHARSHSLDPRPFQNRSAGLGLVFFFYLLPTSAFSQQFPLISNLMGTSPGARGGGSAAPAPRAARAAWHGMCHWQTGKNEM